MRNLIRTIFTYHLFVITGNGKIAASLDSDSGLFIRLNRALSLSVKYYPVVSTKIINAKAKGCLYIPFQLLLFCIGLSNSLSVQFNSIQLVKCFFLYPWPLQLSPFYYNYISYSKEFVLQYVSNFRGNFIEYKRGYCLQAPDSSNCEQYSKDIIIHKILLFKE